jgi:hypothetical protein
MINSTKKKEELLLARIVDDICSETTKDNTPPNCGIVIVNCYHFRNNRNLMKETYDWTVHKYIKGVYGISNNHTITHILSMVENKMGWVDQPPSPTSPIDDLDLTKYFSTLADDVQ